MGMRLEHVKVRQLSATYARAEDSVAELVRRTIDQFEFGSAAILVSTANEDTRVARFTAHLQTILRESAISVQSLEYNQLRSAFLPTHLLKRQDLREITLKIFPAMREKRAQPTALDSVAAGLYTQVQRLLDINLQQP
jgi:hypothetical protein